MAPAFVHLYNPGYEAALSLPEEKSRGYMPPKSVIRLRKDLATLPLYLAREGEKVLVPDDLPDALLTPLMTKRIGPGETLRPWGWSPELSKICEAPFTFDEMRYLTDRVRSVELFGKILAADDGRHFERGTILPRLIHPGESYPAYPHVLKQRFSSSGRGVRFVTAPPDVSHQKHTGDPVIVEPLYPKEQDLGFEFYRHPDGSVAFLGTSLFDTVAGRYTGNRLNDPLKSEIEKEYSLYIDLLASVLSEFDLKGYSGPIGIDTLTYFSGGKRRIAPLIEINIRPTMGLLALELEKRFPRSTRFGIKVGHVPTEGPAAQAPLYLSPDSHPAHISPGLYPLTPMLPDTRFTALIEIH